MRKAKKKSFPFPAVVYVYEGYEGELLVSEKLWDAADKEGPVLVGTYQLQGVEKVTLIMERMPE